MTTGIIAVVIDGSEPSNTALRFANAEAKLRNAVLRVVTVWAPSALYAAGGIAELADQRYEEHDATTTALQGDALNKIFQHVSPDEQPEIDRQIVHGDPGNALVESSKDADLLIVSTEHKVLLKRITAGSISNYCTRYAQIPVVVVP